MLAYLREVFESCKGNDPALSVEDGYSEVCCLNEFEDLGVRVDTVIDIVLSNLNQVNNLIAVIRVSPAEDEAFRVKLVSPIVLIHFHIVSFHHFFLANSSFSFYY